MDALKGERTGDCREQCRTTSERASPGECWLSGDVKMRRGGSFRQRASSVFVLQTPALEKARHL